MYRPRAWIVTIGYELLIGRIVNTNAAHIAKELTLRGAIVDRIVTIGDSIDDIVFTIREALQRADIIVTTGGLGPTDDDKTLEAIAAATNRPLVLNSEALEMINKFYSQRGLPLTPERLKMAYLPAGSTPIPNKVGAAPGMLLYHDTTFIIALPGVPREMEEMLPLALDKIQFIFPKICVIERGIEVKGIPESTLAPLLRRASKKCLDCYVKSHPKGHELREPIIDVKVLAFGNTCEEAEKKANTVLAELSKLIGEHGRSQ
jgi:nicotinamide-nucleotide amidase